MFGSGWSTTGKPHREGLRPGGGEVEQCLRALTRIWAGAVVAVVWLVDAEDGVGGGCWWWWWCGWFDAGGCVGGSFDFDCVYLNLLTHLICFKAIYFKATERVFWAITGWAWQKIFA